MSASVPSHPSVAEVTPELLEAQERMATSLQRELWSNLQRAAVDQMKFSLKSQLTELIFRLAVLSVGTFFAYLGYRLFLSGFIGPASLEAKAAGYSLSLGQAAPGIFFALFGTILIVVGISRLLPVPRAQAPEVRFSTGGTAENPEKPSPRISAQVH